MLTGPRGRREQSKNLVLADLGGVGSGQPCKGADCKCLFAHIRTIGVLPVDATCYAFRHALVRTPAVGSEHRIASRLCRKTWHRYTFFKVAFLLSGLSGGARPAYRRTPAVRRSFNGHSDEDPKSLKARTRARIVLSHQYRLVSCANVMPAPEGALIYLDFSTRYSQDILA